MQDILEDLNVFGNLNLVYDIFYTSRFETTKLLITFGTIWNCIKLLNSKLLFLVTNGFKCVF